MLLSLHSSSATTRRRHPSLPPSPPPSLYSPLSLGFPPRRHRSPTLRLLCSCSSLLPNQASPSPRADVAADELSRLLVLLPGEMRRHLERHPELCHLVEIVMDLGRQPLARFPFGDFVLSDSPISSMDLHHAISQVGDFSGDNRAGISRTLHRISAIRNRKGAIIGLTCRVGRAVSGSADLLRDLVEDGGSLLLIGPPGVGKTTIIREIARMLADDFRKRVMIVDTSNEIGGDGDIPHAGIGSARRLQVPDPNMQHKVMIEAVENHMPQVIVIDEIGTKLEAVAASTIAQRGIQLVATAHGVTIENLIMNPSLEMLVGGIQSVTLGDEEANRRGVQKTVLERKGPSTFTCGAEIISKTELRVHCSLEATVDSLLAGRSPNSQVRKINPNGSSREVVAIQMENVNAAKIVDDHPVKYGEEKPDDVFDLSYGEREEASHLTGLGIDLFIYGISKTYVLQAIKQLGMDRMIHMTDNISEANAFLALHSKIKKNSQLQAAAKSHGMPIYVTKVCSLVQISKAIHALMKEVDNGQDDLDNEEEPSSLEKADALEEARLAIEQAVIPNGKHVQLLPRPSWIISAQIDLVKRYKLKWEKVGQEPNMSLRVVPFHSNVDEKNAADQDVHLFTDGFEEFGLTDDINGTQNGITRLPLLPD